MSYSIKSALWLMYFSTILVAWVVLYQASTGMGLDLIGRPSPDMATMVMDQPGGDTVEDMAGMTMPVMEEAVAPATGERTTPAAEPPVIGDRPADMIPGTGGPGVDMTAMTRFVPLFGMWSIMMAAMMLPTLVPTLTTYERLITSATGTRAGWLGVLSGYAIVWIGVAALLALTQITLLRAGVIDTMGVARSTWIAGGMLIAVGAFQFSRAKEVCHGVCHAPMTYFLGHWRTGFAGSFRMGAVLGIYCAGCCWGFMALGFAGGMMNLLWMGLATVFMVLEKLPQIGHRVTKPIGVLLGLGGLAVLTYPYIAA